MHEHSTLTSNADPRRVWLVPRVAAENLRAVVIALHADEEPEACLRAASGETVVVTSARILVARDGVIQRQLRHADLLRTELSVEAGRADLRFVSSRFASLCVPVSPDQLLNALEAIESVQLGMAPALVQ